MQVAGPVAKAAHACIKNLCSCPAEASRAFVAVFLGTFLYVALSSQPPLDTMVHSRPIMGATHNSAA
jgi:hypothetical protein